MNPTDPLAQLREIHLPAPVSFWPPAIGWWILAIFVLFCLIALAYFIHRQVIKKQYRRLARKELNRIYLEYQSQKNTIENTKKINRLLKQVSVVCYGKNSVARLTDSAWLAFLDERGNTQAFSQGVGKVLISAPYSQELSFSDRDANELQQCVAQWIRKHQ